MSFKLSRKTSQNEGRKWGSFRHTTRILSWNEKSEAEKRIVSDDSDEMDSDSSPERDGSLLRRPQSMSCTSTPLATPKRSAKTKSTTTSDAIEQEVEQRINAIISNHLEFALATTGLIGSRSSVMLNYYDDQEKAANTLLSNGRTLLYNLVKHITRANKQERYVNIVLNQSADPNIRDDAGFTAAMLATTLGYSNTTKRLLSWKMTDLSTTDNEGNTVLILAAKYQNHSSARHFCKALKSRRNQSDQSSLVNEQWQAKNKLCLLQIQNREGNSARSVAVINEDADMVRLIDNHRKYYLDMICRESSSPRLTKMESRLMKQKTTVDETYYLEAPFNNNCGMTPTNSPRDKMNLQRTQFAISTAKSVDVTSARLIEFENTNLDENSSKETKHDAIHCSSSIKTNTLSPKYFCSENILLNEDWSQGKGITSSKTWQCQEGISEMDIEPQMFRKDTDIDWLRVNEANIVSGLKAIRKTERTLSYRRGSRSVDTSPDLTRKRKEWLTLSKTHRLLTLCDEEDALVGTHRKLKLAQSLNKEVDKNLPNLKHTVPPKLMTPKRAGVRRRRRRHSASSQPLNDSAGGEWEHHRSIDRNQFHDKAGRMYGASENRNVTRLLNIYDSQAQMQNYSAPSPLARARKSRKMGSQRNISFNDNNTNLPKDLHCRSRPSSLKKRLFSSSKCNTSTEFPTFQSKLSRSQYAAAKQRSVDVAGSREVGGSRNPLNRSNRPSSFKGAMKHLVVSAISRSQTNKNEMASGEQGYFMIYDELESRRVSSDIATMTSELSLGSND